MPEILAERLRFGFPLFHDAANITLDELLRDCIAPEVVEMTDAAENAHKLGENVLFEHKLNNEENYSWIENDESNKDLLF